MKKILAVLVVYSPVFAMNANTRLNNVETRLTNVENVVAEHDTQLGEIRNLLKDDISPGETDPMSYYDILINLGNRISVVESDIINHNTELTNIRERITNINNRLTDHDSKLNIIDEHLIRIDNSLINHNNRLNTIDEHLLVVDNRLDNIDEHLVTVDNRLDNIDEHLITVDNRLNNIDDHLIRVDNDVEEIKLQVRTNTSAIESIRNTLDPMTQSIQGVSTGIGALSTTITNISKQVADMQITLTTLDTKFNEQLENAWEEFVDKKFQAYMEEKKIVLDVITACKINGDPTPEYIMETAEQLQECDLKTRRETLSEILTKLTLFERLLDGEKLESIQNYLNDTNVPDPIIKEIEKFLSNAIVDRDCIKVTGATKTFTRTTDLKRGLPHEGWMNPDYDYFAYRKYPYVKNLINQENARRQTQNAENERANELAQATYKAGINAANRMTFPSQNFTDLVTDYNRLLTHHDI